MITSTDSKNICFISHNATRSGAPIVLYNLVRWIKEYQQDDVEVWFLEGGEMLDDFNAICICRVLQQKNASRFSGLIKKVRQKISGTDFFLRRQLKGLHKFEVVCFNTIASLRAVPLLTKGKQARWIAYLHEQPYSINKYYKDYCTAEILNRIDRFIVVSGKTSTFLVSDFKISSENIKVLPPFIDIRKLLNEIPAETDKNQQDPFIIGACGLQYWLKGPDLFLRLASFFKKKHPELFLRFVWVGAPGSMTNDLQYELIKMDLQETVQFTGDMTEVIPVFKSFDLFVLTSRDDSFPLVVLEACALQKPVICFSGVGDITNLVDVIPENVVPYADVESMAERILFYINNAIIKEADGEILRQEVSKFDVSFIAPEFYKNLKETK